MGSWYELKVDGLSVWGGKSYVEDDVIMLFQERDRRVRPDPRLLGDEGDTNIYEYAVSALDMRERLDVLGFSAERTRADYEHGRNEDFELSGTPEFKGVFNEAVEKPYPRWQSALKKAVLLGYQRWNDDLPEWFGNDDIALISNGGELGFGSYFSEIRFLIRGVLEALPDAHEIILDYSDLVSGGYLGADEPICANTRLQWAATRPAYGPIVLLTEGRSDTKILSAAFAAIVPHLADYYSFLDFEALKIQGSTDALAKMIRAFVGARVSMQMVAIFDNDAAGVAGLQSLSDVALPPNMKALTLPECEICRAYPTEGPQGSAIMDVNGSAASIELYLGQEALRNEAGRFRPVRWSGYDTRSARYQGAVEEKHLIQQSFFAKLQGISTPVEARNMFPDLARVIDMISMLFRDAENTIRKERNWS